MDPWANTWADDHDDPQKQSMTFPGLGLPPAPDPLPSLSAFDTAARPPKASLHPASDNAWADPVEDGLAKKLESSWPGEAGLHNNPDEHSPRPDRLSWNPENDDGFITADQSLDGSPADKPDKGNELLPPILRRDETFVLTCNPSTTDSYFDNTRQTADTPWATGQHVDEGEEKDGSPARAASDASSSEHRETPEQDDDHGDWGKMDLPPLTHSPRVSQEPEEDQGLHQDDGAWGAMDLPPLPSEDPDALPVWDSKEAPLPAKKPQEEEQDEESEEEPGVDNNMHANDLWAALVDPSEPRAFLVSSTPSCLVDYS